VSCRLAFELNDAGVTAVADDGEPLPPSPGYALFDGDELLVGRRAAARARLRPRRLHTRFWELLDDVPLRRPYPPDFTAADLVHAHLGEVWERAGAAADEVLLAVPGWWNEAQLALLLGVARAAGIPVVGLVDAAVAAVAGRRGGRLLHLELQLHRAVLTVVRADGGVSRQGVVCSERIGLVALRDAWARQVASVMVRATRYDPLHDAGSEQQLYDALPRWLDDLGSDGTTTALLGTGGRQHRVHLTREQLIAPVEPQVERLLELVHGCAEPSPAAVLVGGHAATVPGLVERLSVTAGCPVERLPMAAAAVGALSWAERVRHPGEQALPFVTTLAETAAEPNGSADTRPHPADQPTPTHLVYRGLAYPLTERPLEIGTAPRGPHRLTLPVELDEVAPLHCRVLLEEGQAVLEACAGAATAVNGRQLEGPTRLAAGDRIRLGAARAELELVAEVRSDSVRYAG
jgi:hypothetical protein